MKRKHFALYLSRCLVRMLVQIEQTVVISQSGVVPHIVAVSINMCRSLSLMLTIGRNCCLAKQGMTTVHVLHLCTHYQHSKATMTRKGTSFPSIIILCQEQFKFNRPPPHASTLPPTPPMGQVLPVPIRTTNV